MIATVFATIEKGIPKVYNLNFHPIIKTKDSVDIRVKIDSLIVYPPDNRIFSGFRGESNAIKNIVKNYNWGDIPNDIKTLISIQIQNTPEKVGFPINIIRIDSGGIHWIEKNHFCE